MYKCFFPVLNESPKITLYLIKRTIHPKIFEEKQIGVVAG